ncbi:hypothetical protein ACLKA6_005668 [Drosophila palustris]
MENRAVPISVHGSDQAAGSGRRWGALRFSFLRGTTPRSRKGTILCLTLGPASWSTSPRRRTQDHTVRLDLVLWRWFGNRISVRSAFYSKALSGDQAWKHLDPVRVQNVGLFRFLSTDLTRRPGLGDVGASLE